MPTSVKTEKIYVRLPQDRLESIKLLAQEIGMPYTQFAGLLLWMGYKTYERNVNPERAFTPEQWAQMAKAMGSGSVDETIKE